MTIAYFDCFSGVAGDMVLGAMVDAGLPLAHLKKQLRLLPLRSYEIKIVKEHREFRGANISVVVKDNARAADYRTLDGIIARCRLPKPVKILSRAIFERIARAEARVHRCPVDRVHFHEVGAIDSVVDIVGAAIGFDYFGFDAVHSSPLPITRGYVKCMHGMMPVPAPATLEIIKGVPIEPARIKSELVTPTGAAILVTMAESFGECPIQKIDAVGYGFGDKVFPGVPNALRLMTGEGFRTVIIQCDIDDMNPQMFDGAMEAMFRAGAVDVDMQPVQMKKNRPAVRLSAIVPWEKKDKVIDVMLRETTTFGVRYWPVERRILLRRLVQKKIKRGTMTFKIGCDHAGNIVKVMPEYEDIKKIAQKQKRPVLEVYNEALRTYSAPSGPGEEYWTHSPALRATA